MELPQLPLDGYVAICLVIATPWLYRTFGCSKSSTDQALSTLLLLHTFYILHALFVSPPQNIFKTLGLHPTASPEALRAGVSNLYGGDQNVPHHLDTLLKKLGLMDLRLIYIRCVTMASFMPPTLTIPYPRFGHHVLTTCSYCQSFDDFALYAFPGPLLEYIREIAFVGVHISIHILSPFEVYSNDSLLALNPAEIIHGAPPPSRTRHTARSPPVRSILDSNSPSRHSTRK